MTLAPALTIPFDNSYARLPESLYTRQAPRPVAAPRLLALNDDLARELGLDPEALRTPEGLAMLSGNVAPPGADPLAQAYGGHQFGHWNPGLGDGRAILLGEVVGAGGRRDIQLKGSGRTPYSRGGDGRAWLGPVLREYLVSEAMHALGVPTTRALAAVATGETVYRETPLPGAVLTRIAASHLRVGTFQLAAAREDLGALSALTDHALARHYPDATGPAGLLASVTAAQAELIAHWIGLGFIHGVMNTDNCAISGETIDYGPCAFMDDYHPGKVFSAIDQGGRYAYANQPQIALWNLAQLATALIPLMPDAEAAVEEFTAIINRFADLYQAAWARRFAAKVGLAPSDDATALARELLDLMAAGGSDFTATFVALERGTGRDHVLDRDAFDDWERRWRALSPDPAVMARNNPRMIPRTHLIEAAIAAGVDDDLGPFRRLLAAVTRPFETPDDDFGRPPTRDERVTRTYCGT